ncbi:MAG: endolytic transglycosylase MltG [Candidatus Binatia bacterium]|nr:endolytic transglycosylase MltG [Candidatus Binatia bacterium]
MQRKALRLAVFSVFAALASGGWSWWDMHRQRSLPPEGLFLRVEPGDTLSGVATELAEGGFLATTWNLKLWGKALGSDRRLRPGDYLFQAPLSPRQLLAELEAGRLGRHELLVREGDTVAEVAAQFAARGFGGADVLRCALQNDALRARVGNPPTGLEGYLFPDTYYFAWSDEPEVIVAAMLDRFQERTRDLHPARQRLGLSVHEMVTLASIIEKETGVADERPLVSAVFHNRLRAGMKLQADPTAIYGQERQGPPDRADLEAEHAYNTYRHFGLPPGPICNPGRAALEAAVNPAPVDYLYFVARGDGTHAFARSLEEHNRNVARWRGNSAAAPPSRPRR